MHILCSLLTVQRTFFEHLNVMAQVDVGQVLDDDVEAGAADGLQHLLLVPLVVVVEHVMGSAFSHNIHPVLRGNDKKHGIDL